MSILPRKVTDNNFLPNNFTPGPVVGRVFSPYEPKELLVDAVVVQGNEFHVLLPTEVDRTLPRVLARAAPAQEVYHPTHDFVRILSAA